MNQNKNNPDKEIHVNDKRYNVEIAKDITIPVIETTYVNNQTEITGYTAGLITRDLVTIGEKMLKDKAKK